MNQQKAWLAPAKRALFLVTIRSILALLPLLVGGLLGGGDCTLQEGILIFMCLLLGMPWFVLILLIRALEAILPDIVFEFLLPFTIISLGTIMDYVLAFVFILAKNRKDRWISFAIHSVPILLGAMFWILFVLASARE